MAEWFNAVVLKTNEVFLPGVQIPLSPHHTNKMFLLFINFEESLFILLIALIIFGPKKIPEVARSMGYGIKYFKKYSQSLKKEIGEVCDQIGDLKDITSELDNNNNSIEGTIHRND